MASTSVPQARPSQSTATRGARGKRQAASASAPIHNHASAAPATSRGRTAERSNGEPARDGDDMIDSSESESYTAHAGQDDYSDEDDAEAYSTHARHPPHHHVGHSHHHHSHEDRPSQRKRPRGASRNASSYGPDPSEILNNAMSSLRLPRPPVGVSNNTVKTIARSARDNSLWNTSTQEERARIKEFWLSLSEDERKSLLKIEKDAVLRKMKEQQKYSCSCTVCGRKRTAIEEELEALYDAYYDELEQYANKGQQALPAPLRQTPPTPPPPPPRALRSASLPARSRIREVLEDELSGFPDQGVIDDGYSDELDDESYASDAYPPMPPSMNAGFFDFGNSLTVKGGILTVADDLLQNDGRKFIDMMEQLAERRMQREHEVHYHTSQPVHHPPPLDLPLDDEEEFEDEEDYDSQDDYDQDYEVDEMGGMTEEQRMEEGRRMFQIFAARMFEQRVLTAYREQVAAERQRKLLEELDDESKLDEQRKDKKASLAEKKKEKKRAANARKAEIQAQKDKRKAEQDAAAKAAQEAAAEEQRARKEAQRLEAQAKKDKKKQEEDARKAKAEEKVRQKRQEAEEREAKAAEAKRLKAQEAKERKEREDKEREDKEREAAELETKQRETKERDQREAQEAEALRQAREDEAKSKQAPEKREIDNRLEAPSQGASAMAKTLSQQGAGKTASPHTAVATPVMPKAMATNRARQNQPKDSRIASPAVPASNTSSQRTSPSSLDNTSRMPSGQMPIAKPVHPQIGQSKFGPNNGAPTFGVPNGFGHNAPSMMPGNRQQPPAQHMPGYRMHQPLHANQALGNITMAPPPGFLNEAPTANHFQPAPIGAPLDLRQNDHGNGFGGAGRPAPIQRPSSSLHAQPAEDESNRHLGSSALLDDADEPLPQPDTRKYSNPPGMGRGQMRFAPPVYTALPGQPSFNNTPTWASPNVLSPSHGAQMWGNALPGNNSWNSNTFGTTSRPSHASRPLLIRLAVCHACRQLSHGAPEWHDVPVLLRQMDMNNHLADGPPSLKELEEICETEGDAHNGGGSLSFSQTSENSFAVRFDDGPSAPNINRTPGAGLGEIGSPVSPPNQSHRLGKLGDLAPGGASVGSAGY